MLVNQVILTFPEPDDEPFTLQDEIDALYASIREDLGSVERPAIAQTLFQPTVWVRTWELGLSQVGPIHCGPWLEGVDKDGIMRGFVRPHTHRDFIGIAGAVQLQDGTWVTVEHWRYDDDNVTQVAGRYLDNDPFVEVLIRGPFEIFKRNGLAPTSSHKPPTPRRPRFRCKLSSGPR